MSNRGSSASCRLQHCSSRAVATSLDPLSSGVCPVIWSLSCLLESVLSCHLESVLSSGVCPVIWSLSCPVIWSLSCHLESVLSCHLESVLSSGVCPVIWSLSCHLESVLSALVCLRTKGGALRCPAVLRSVTNLRITRKIGQFPSSVAKCRKFSLLSFFCFCFPLPK